jgi:hypothetical protein
MSIQKRIFIILLSVVYGSFVFMCLLHMGGWSRDLGMLLCSSALALWNMGALAIFTIVPKRLSGSKVFAMLHSALFLLVAALLSYAAYDLAFVHIDALNAIAFITLPVLTSYAVAVFYGLSLLIHWLSQGNRKVN